MERKEHTETILTAMPMGRLGLGRTSDDGNADFRNGRIHLRYTVKPHRRRIQCVFRDFQDGKTDVYKRQEMQYMYGGRIYYNRVYM